MDVAKLREITPGCAKVVHLNNAGCSLPTQETLDAVISYLNKEALYGGYETLDAATAALQLPYDALASLLNCRPEEIAVVTSATEAWQQVVYGLAATWRPGDRLLTSLCEYGSNYIAYLHLRKRTGVEIEVIPETQEGDLCADALQGMLAAGNVVLVSLNHVPTSSGRVYDVAMVGRLTREHGVLFMLDACQSVGQLPVDVQRIGCDFLSGTGRKYLRAPRGSGFLYCSQLALGLLEPATLDNTGAWWSEAEGYELRPGARRFERYEMSFAAKVGLGIAVQRCVDIGADFIWDRIATLGDALRTHLSQLPGVHVHDKGAVLCGIVSFTVDGKSADEVRAALHAKGINTSASRVPSSRLDFEEQRWPPVPLLPPVPPQQSVAEF